jgi:hypothetical protein
MARHPSSRRRWPISDGRCNRIGLAYFGMVLAAA